MRVPGNDSIRILQAKLIARLGNDAIDFGSLIHDEQDAFGWHCIAAPGIDFSISTHAGQLPDGQYDLQVSVRDNTLENGDILFTDDVDVEGVITQIERFAQGPAF